MGFHTVSASWLVSAFIGPAGRRLAALFGGVTGPPRINGVVHLERGLLMGRRHRLLELCGRLSVEIGGARALVPAPSRIDR